MPAEVMWSVFTKPWPAIDAADLAQKVAGFGFQAVELPVRDGFQVTPAQVNTGLPKFAATLADHGITIRSVASTTEESVFAACAGSGVPMIRVMVPVGNAGYLAAESATRHWLDATVPLCRRYGVQIGIQPHHGRFVADATGLRALIAQYPAECVGAVWDAAHDALAGAQPEYSLELLWSQLAMVNLKNAYYRRTNGPESDAEWATYFTTAQHGLANWPRIAAYLAAHSYNGPICLTAEYSMKDRVDTLLGPDLAYAKSLF